MTVAWIEAPPATLNLSLSTIDASGVLWRANESVFVLDFPGVVAFRVADGNVYCARLGDTPGSVAAMIGAGLPSAAAWIQRGCVALHAAAVATPGGAIVIAGASAAGKSVLAATLAQRGYPVVADEVTPLIVRDGETLAMHTAPNCPVLLWQDAVANLGLDDRAGLPLRPGLMRFAITGLGGTAPAPLPVRAIYLLGVHNRPDIAVTALTGRERVLAILAGAFDRYLPQPPDARARTLLLLTARLADVPVMRLLRPRLGWSAPKLADVVLEAAR